VNTIDDLHRALLGVLVRHDVRFVLVGGVALQLHGFSGATRDVDVTIATDPANEHRVAVALAALGARAYLTGDRGSAYHTDLGQLEVTRYTDGVGDYDAWSRQASTIEVERGLVVRVGSTSDLLLAKERSGPDHAGREKDTEALPLIRAELLANGSLAQRDIRGPVAALPIQAPVDPRLAQLLGPRPAQRRARGMWDHAGEMIREYRERWALSDDGPLLANPAEPDSPQAQDLAAVQQRVERVRRLLAARQ